MSKLHRVGWEVGRVAEVVYCEEEKVQRGIEREKLGRYLDLLDLMSRSLFPTNFLGQFLPLKKKSGIFLIIGCYWSVICSCTHTHTQSRVEVL